MKLHFTDHGDADANLDLLRALADANSRRGRSDRLTLIHEHDGQTTAFYLEGIDSDGTLTGVVEDIDHGPLPARLPLTLVRSIEFPGI